MREVYFCPDCRRWNLTALNIGGWQHYEFSQFQEEVILSEKLLIKVKTCLKCQKKIHSNFQRPSWERMKGR